MNPVTKGMHGPEYKRQQRRVQDTQHMMSFVEQELAQPRLSPAHDCDCNQNRANRRCGSKLATHSDEGCAKKYMQAKLLYAGGGAWLMALMLWLELVM
jgi:hypothetical protein